MVVPRRLSALLASAVAAQCLLTGCASEEEPDVASAEAANTSATPGAAPIGVASSPLFGERSWGPGGDQLTIKQADGSSLVRQARGFSPLSIESDQFGPPLVASPDQRAGWQTGTAKWKCQDAERFATNKVTYTDASQLCHVEINPTGGQGFAITIFGLDSRGEGLSRYRAPARSPAPRPHDGGAVKLIASGPPRAVNVAMDPKVADAMFEAQTKFAAPKTERNDCLKNARAVGWLDVQAHYYCLLPYNDVRLCYSTKLVEEGSSTDAARKARAALTAYAACFAPPENGAPDTRTASARWLHENQEAAFKYIMFTKQGVADFDLATENAAISAFYARTGEPRPRRVMDTFPAWLADQPRYVAIRKMQADAQAATAADGGT